jgi:signal transduction histidine kinase
LLLEVAEGSLIERRRWDTEAPSTPAVVACAGLVVLLTVLAAGQVHPTASPHVPWWALTLLFTVTEVGGAGLPRDRRALAAPSSRIPLVIGLYLAAPVELILAQALGMAIAAAPRWRHAPWRTAFSISAATLATCLGVWAYLLMTDRTAPRGPEGWADGLVAAAVVVAASTLFSARSSEVRRRARLLLDPWTRQVLIADVLAVATGLVAAEIIRTDRYAAWLLVVPALAAYAVRRQYELADWRADALGVLHLVARQLQRASDRGSASALALQHSRTLCRATHAEIVLREEEGRFRRWEDREEGTSPRSGELIDPGADLLEALDAQVGARVTPVRRRAGLLSPVSHPFARDQVIVVPVEEHGAVVGYLRLEGRRGRRPVTRLELAVVETLVASLGVALETIRGVDELAERAQRDADLLAQIEEVNRQLERVSDAKSVFLATTSHELRAPLTALLAETELLDRLLPAPRDGEDPCRRLVSGARSNAEHLLRLVDDLLDLSRIEAGQLELRMAPMDLRQVAGDVVAALQPVVTDRLTLELRGGDPSPITGDRDRIWQVVANLVNNAANATPRGAGPVRVEVTSCGSESQLRVIDAGVGIPDDQLERMFSPFEQGPDRGRGLGLGLTIARYIVEAHGGTLQATSTPGIGSCFTATFRAGAPPTSPTFALPAPLAAPPS